MQLYQLTQNREPLIGLNGVSDNVTHRINQAVFRNVVPVLQCMIIT
jgi:hypothetical protein